VIASGDTLSTIAVAYSKELNAKITTALILKANPTLKPEKMKVGQTILIPVPEK
jgi:LysM repeat protein